MALESCWDFITCNVMNKAWATFEGPRNSGYAHIFGVDILWPLQCLLCAAFMDARALPAPARLGVQEHP